MITRYVLPLFAIVAFVFAAKQMTSAQQKTEPAAPPVAPAKSPFAKQLAGAGIVEPDTENIIIGTHLPGVIERIYVKVGDAVRPGQTLFRLDDRHLRAELDVRNANLGSTLASLERTNNLPRAEELPPLRAKVAEAEANLQDQNKMYDRLRKLSTTVISEDELSRREMGVEVAKAQLLKAKADIALQESGAWKFDRVIAGSAVKQMQTLVEQTKIELTRLTVNAPRLLWDDAKSAEPTEFKVLQISVRPGEYVSTLQGQSLIVLGHVGKLNVRVDIDENDIGRFRPNLSGYAQPRGNATVMFPIEFVRVEPYVIPKKSLTGASTERVDTRVLQVIYRLDLKDRPLFVGQQMEVFLNTDEQK